MLKFEKKIEAGAQWFQTQAVYDMDNFKRFMEQARKINDKVKICAGLVLLTSMGAIKYMNANVPGVFVPDELVKEMADAPKGEALNTGIRIMARQIRMCMDEKLCDGVHIMAIGKRAQCRRSSTRPEWISPSCSVTLPFAPAWSEVMGSGVRS